MEEKTSEQIAQEIRDLEAKQQGEGGSNNQQQDQQQGGDDKSGEGAKAEDKEKEGEQNKKSDDDDFEFEDPFEEVKEEKKKETKKSKEEDKSEEGEDDKDADDLSDEDKSEEGEDDKDADDLSDEDKKLIDERVKSQVDAFKAEAEAEKTRNVNWDKYVADNPHLSKYSENIRPYMHKVYDTLVNKGINGVKVNESKAFDVITAMILGKGMYKIGARMEAEARSKANAGSQNTNGSRKQEGRTAGGIPDVTNMSSEEFKQLEMQVVNGEFKPAS